MKSKEFIYINILAFLLIVAIVYVSISIVKSESKFKYKKYETEYADGTTIHRGQYGLAYINASNSKKAYFALGFVQARDRLFQMEYMRMAATGRLSEIYGSSKIGFDKFIRSFELERLSENQSLQISENEKVEAEAFVDGINSFIDNQKGMLSVEYDLHDLKPEKWKLSDIYLMYNYHAFVSSKHVIGDLALTSFDKVVELDILEDLLAGKTYSENAKPFFEEAIIDSTFISFDTIIGNDAGVIGQGGCNLFIDTRKIDSTYRSVLGNDMHAALVLPQPFYPTHLSFDGTFITGMTLVGTPLFLSGRNDKVSWGRTYLQGDDINYQIVELDSSGNNLRFDKSEPFSEIEFTVDTIRVKNKPYVPYYKRSVNGKTILADGLIYKTNGYGGSSTSFNTGREMIPYLSNSATADPIGFGLKLNSIDSIEQVGTFKNIYSVPTMFLGLTDTEGRRGTVIIGDTITYQTSIGSEFNNSNSTGSINNISKVETGEGKVSNSSFDEKVKGSILYSDNSRKERLQNLMDESIRFTYQEADMISLDAYSGFYLLLAEKVSKIITENTKSRSTLLEYRLDKLESWNGIVHHKSIEYHILNNILKSIKQEVFSDKIPKRTLNYIWKNGIIDKLIIRMIDDELLLKKLEFSNEDLVRILVKETENRDLDNVIELETPTITLPSIFGGIDNDTNMLDPSYIVNAEKRGSTHSVLYLNDRGDVPVGVAYRFIADMGNDKVYMSMPSGTSANLVSDYYDNLVQYWKIGANIKIPLVPEYSDLQLEFEFF
ncbi:MAG: penicillin acylase family protein [Candidatus Kapaibacteriales bacterium]